MTVPATEAKAGPFSGDGVNRRFPFEFEAMRKEFLAVYVDNMQLAGGYSVELRDGGGDVVLDSPLRAGSRLAILLDLPIAQETDLQNNTAFLPEVIEGTADYGRRIDQMLRELISRCIMVGPTTPGDATPEDLLRQLYEALAAALAAAEEAARYAALAALAKSGVLNFPIPKATAGRPVSFYIEFSLDKDFSTQAAEANTLDHPSLFAILVGDKFETPPGGGFDVTYSNRQLFFFPFSLGLVTEQIYYGRYRWDDGNVFSDWEGLIYLMPDISDTPAPGPDPEPVVPTLAVADLPNTVTGLELSFSGGQLKLSPGWAPDSTQTTVLRSKTVLSFTPDYSSTQEYSAYLIGKANGVTALWASAGGRTYDVPWTSPRMFASDYPSGYAASASSEYNTTQTAWKAFDKNTEANNDGWASLTGAVMPQYVQQIFDSPKRVTKVTIRNRASGNRSRAVRCYSQGANGVWALVPGASAELANTASSAAALSFATPVVCTGIRVEVTSVWSGSYAALAEVAIEGFTSRQDETVPLSLPTGYERYRKVGEFRALSGKNTVDNLKPVSQQRLGLNEGRIWVSEPQALLSSGLYQINHGVALDPLRAQAQVLFQCLTPEGGYTAGEFLISPTSGTSRYTLTPALNAGNIKLRVRDSIVGHHASSNAVFTPTPGNWAVFFRIFY